jgi:glycosyltransferase involved in cell wall biosynthesis
MSDKDRVIVSVIMNCYNSDKYLKEAIDSIYQQTYTNWEIIFWDNDSNDTSANIAKSYDKKLKYFRAENTTLLGEARILAVEKSNGKYLAFLDCDDYWYQDKLEKQMKIFDLDSEIAVVYSRAELLFEDSGDIKIFPRKSKLKNDFVFKDLVKEDFVPFPSVVLDKKKFLSCGGFPIHFRCATDYWVLLHLARDFKFRAIDDVCCVYRIHQSNLSHSLAITSAKESIELVSLFLPDQAAISGLRHQYVNLAICFFRQKLFLSSLAILLRERILLLALKRIIEKLHRVFN